MTLTLKEKELLKQALHLYVQETAGQYDFVKDLDMPFSSDFEKSMQRLIKRQKKPMYYLLNTTIKKVACIIVAIVIALTCTVLSVDALRQRVKNFVIETFEKFSILTFDEDSDAPDHIQVYYAPSFIPEGYKMSEIQRSELFTDIEYENNNQDKIHFLQSVIFGNGTNVNTENGEVEEIGNGLYIRHSQIQHHVYFWSDDEYEFSLSATLSISKEELLKIADSLKEQQ